MPDQCLLRLPPLSSITNEKIIARQPTYGTAGELRQTLTRAPYLRPIPGSLSNKELSENQLS